MGDHLQLFVFDLTRHDLHQVVGLDIATARVTLTVRFRDIPGEDEVDIADLQNELDFELTTLFNELFFELAEGQPLLEFEEKVIEADREFPIGVQPNDRIGVTLRIGGPNGGTFFRMTRMRNNPLRALFSMIASIIQSNRDLLFNEWQFEFQVVHIPLGMGKRKRVWNNELVYCKKSVVDIRARDGLCTWRALVVCRAYAQYQTHPIDGVDDARAQAHKRYKKIARHGSRLQTNLAQQLQRDTRTYNGNLDDLVTIAHHWKCNITVINRSMPKWVEFRTCDTAAGAAYDTTLYMLRVDDHFLAINSIKGFFATDFYCDACNVHTCNGRHRCPGSTKCWLCNREPEEHVDPRIPSIRCDVCFRTFDDGGCYGIHLNKLCKRSWR